MAHDFTFGAARLTALPSGALLWRDLGILCVSDLHLGKSQRMARRAGALLPPYEVAETLSNLAADIAAHGPQTVVCLGDSFDDLAAGAGLDVAARAQLAQLQTGRTWIWIEGNHDAGPLDLHGTSCAQFAAKGIVFRHIAQPDLAGETPEISGHYHPKARLAGQGHRAFLLSAHRLILPAYGAYTGGMWASAPPLDTLMPKGSRALVLHTGRVLQIPLSAARR